MPIPIVVWCDSDGCFISLAYLLPLNLSTSSPVRTFIASTDLQLAVRWAGNTGQVLIKAPAGHGGTVSLHVHALVQCTLLAFNWLASIDGGRVTVEVTDTYMFRLALWTSPSCTSIYHS